MEQRESVQGEIEDWEEGELGADRIRSGQDSANGEDPAEGGSGSADPEREGAAGGGSAPANTRMAKLEEEAERWKDAALRRQADLENYRKRVAREQSEAMRYANERLLGELLAVLDHFELGLQAARQATDPAGVVLGMEMIARQLELFLEGQRVQTIDAAPGDPFDPNRHEAVGQEEDVELSEGLVLRQLRKGYQLGDRLLRPAAVVVSRGSGEDRGSGRTTE
ncbi:MAG TPA: nucleotide exchange factor GrpE [Verrucomicrobiales bacterium]|nr:nucleotide exchange factor GrpE [Verrucomicrobiales bacterium]